MRPTVLSLLVVLVGSPTWAMGPRCSVDLTPAKIATAQWSPEKACGEFDPVVLKAEVLLSRAGFSPGVIDANDGENFEKALRAYQAAVGLDSTGIMDEPTWSDLAATSTEAIVRDYQVTPADVKGPFVAHIPADFRKMAKLRRLAYHSPRELLAEKFHASEDLLSALDKGAALNRAGTEIVVPNVEPLEVPRRSDTKKRPRAEHAGVPGGPATVRVEVDKSERAVRVFGSGGGLIRFYPASIGSVEKPAPSGTFEVTSVTYNPTYRYNPKFAFKGQKARKPVRIAPGPNNPVGVVWISLSARSYGIHGTPDPEKVSKTMSHGCIRLTNWDAVALAKLVRKGTRVDFLD